MKQFCWGSDTKIVGEMPQIQSEISPFYLPYSIIKGSLVVFHCLKKIFNCHHEKFGCFFAINKGWVGWVGWLGGWPKVCSNPDGNPVGNVQAAQIPAGGGERNTKEKRCSCYAKTNTSKSQQGALGKKQQGADFATFLLQKQM